AGEDPILAVSSEADEPGQAVLDAERDHDLPPPPAKERGRGAVDALELGREHGPRQRFERVYGVLREHVGLGDGGVGVLQAPCAVLADEEVTALDVEDLAQLLAETLHELLAIEHVYEGGRELAQAAAVVVIL